MKRYPSGIFLFLFSALTSVEAQVAVEAPALRTGTPAEGIHTPQAIYPMSEAFKEGEGWVKLQYDITEQGTVANIKVIELVGSPRFAEAATKALNRWKFKPATLDGKPIVDKATQSEFAFYSESKATGATATHKHAYQEIQRLITSGKLDEAEARLEQIFSEDLNMYEIAYFSRERAALERLRGDVVEEVGALELALHAGYLATNTPDPELMASLFVAQARAEEFASALDTFEDMKRYKAAYARWGEYEHMQAQIIALRDGSEPIISTGVITQKRGMSEGTFYHALLRSSIEFAQIQGALGRFEVQCEERSFEDEVATDRNWALPASWGRCHLAVFGEPGATFKLVELPAASP